MLLQLTLIFNRRGGKPLAEISIQILGNRVINKVYGSRKYLEIIYGSTHNLKSGVQKI